MVVVVVGVVVAAVVVVVAFSVAVVVTAGAAVVASAAEEASAGTAVTEAAAVGNSEDIPAEAVIAVSGETLLSRMSGEGLLINIIAAEIAAAAVTAAADDITGQGTTLIFGIEIVFLS